MSVVVSDTSPLHYLILCDAQCILPRLFRQVVIPPAVFLELQQANTPPLVRQWAASLPAWIAIQSPKRVDLALDVDAGELEAICLAQETHAAALLIDDRAGRNAAIHCGLAVVGTVGLLEEAATREFIELPTAFARLRKTNARLAPALIHAALAHDQARRQKR